MQFTIDRRPALGRLRLIRHARPGDDEEGGMDPPLSDDGRAQADRLSRRMQADPPHVLLCSPLRRAVETAAVIGRATGLRPRLWPDLAEAGFLYGQPGRPRSDFTRRYPEVDLPPEITESGWTGGRVEGANECDDVLAFARARTLVPRLRAEAADVCVVTHWTFAWLLICAVLDVDPERFCFSIDHADLVGLTFVEGGGVRLRWVSTPA